MTMLQKSMTSVMQTQQAKDSPHPASTISRSLAESPESFLLPYSELHSTSLALVKRYVDPLATSTSEAQIRRQQISRRKRKRGESIDLGVQKPLQLKEVYLDDFKAEQVWEQARRILDATTLEVERSLERLDRETGSFGPPRKPAKSQVATGKAVQFRNISPQASLSDDSDMEVMDADIDGSIGFEDDPSGERIESSDREHVSNASDLMDEDRVVEEDEIADSDEETEIHAESEEMFIPDKLGLNDGFFSIDDFNRQSDFLERQDAKGENDGAASDEEDVDWDIDPLSMSSSRVVDQDHDGEVGVESKSEDEESGPTFGNADISAPDLSDSDEASNPGVQLEALSSMNNTNDIKYEDFFAPPPRKASKSSRRRALPKTQPPSSTIGPQPDNEAEIQRTISAVRRDIFEDDLTPDEDAASEDEGKSSHQKRQAALTAEIRRLEAAAVAKRDWTLSGEARAADRPINSLLEEDLEFERAGKPIPVITQEVSEDIEAMIKRRILAREFDEVIKRRPQNLATGGEAGRRGKFELEDTKPQQSLADVYEAEQIKAVNPEGYVDKRDEKLKREHAKIEAMWRDVSAKLDALSSWHYKPKPPSANINVVADVPTITMEDARPSAGGDVGNESMLAPQEVYKAGEVRDKKAEVLTGSGLPVGRDEMTRDEKTRRRRREKERIRKAGGLVPTKGAKKVNEKVKEKQGIIGDLKKGEVRVIGKKGEIKDVEGKSVTARGKNVGAGGSGFKL